MKKTLILVVFAIICNSAFSQKKEAADTTKKKDQNTTIKKDKDAQVVHITPGASGVKRSIGYRFSLKRGFEDPGTGIFRYNNDNVSDVTIIYVDNIDISGEDQTKWFSTWDDTTGATARGAITVADNEGNVITVFNFTGVFIDGAGFWILPVEYVSGTLPLDGHSYYYVFDRITHKKEPSNPVVPVTAVPEVVVNPVVPVITIAADPVVVPVIPVTEVITVNPVVPVTPVTEVIVNPVVPVITIAADPVVVPVIPVTEVVTVNPVVPVTPVTEVVVNPVVPVITVAADPVVVPVIPVTEVVTVNPVVPITPVTEVVVNPVVPVITVAADPVIVPVIPVTEVVPAKPAIPSRQRRIADTGRPDTISNPAVQYSTVERTRPLGPVSRDTVVSMAKKTVPEKPVSQTTPVIPEKPVAQAIPEKPATPVTQPKPADPVSQPKPASPVSQPKPVNPVNQSKPTNPVSQSVPATQSKPTNPVSQTVPATQTKPTNPVSQSFPATQPKPANPVNQTYPANQENQNYPAPESNRLPSYQRYTGTSGGIHGKWYRGIIEVGYGLGVGDYGLNNFRFNFINGFKIGNSSLGLGVGYRRYFTENTIAPYLVSKKSEVPVFLDFRTHFSERKVTPYFAIGVGGTASSDTTQSAKDRLFFTTSGGIWLNLSDRFAVFAGIAYELQKLELSDTNPYTGNYRKNSNSLSLNVGIAF